MQLTKKPVPVSLAGWERELQGIIRAMSDLHQYLPDNGDKWLKTQRHYYQVRLLHLIDEQPEAVRRKGVRYRIRIGGESLSLYALQSRYMKP